MSLLHTLNNSAYEAARTLARYGAVTHNRLDQAVAAAYGWEWPLTEEEVLARLLALNGEQAAQQ